MYEWSTLNIYCKWKADIWSREGHSKMYLVRKGHSKTCNNILNRLKINSYHALTDTNNYFKTISNHLYLHLPTINSFKEAIQQIYHWFSIQNFITELACFFILFFFFSSSGCLLLVQLIYKCRHLFFFLFKHKLFFSLLSKSSFVPQ